MNITREQYEADIQSAKIQILLDAAKRIDAEDDDVDYDEITESAGRRHAAEEIEAYADELRSA